MSNPDDIRAEIDATRADLSHNLNTLADTVNPAHAARRQANKMKSAVFGAKDKVMGSASDAGSSLRGTVSDAGSSLSAAQSTATDTITNMPELVRNQAKGNPLAAGLIVFGIGWLTGSLLPASQKEQQMAMNAKEAATPLVTDAAKKIADDLKQPVHEAIESVKESASDAAGAVKDEGRSTAEGLKDEVSDAKDTTVATTQSTMS